MKKFLSVEPNRYTLDELASSIKKNISRNSELRRNKSLKTCHYTKNSMHLQSHRKHLCSRNQRKTINFSNHKECKLIGKLPFLKKQRNSEYLHKNDSKINFLKQKLLAKLKIQQFQLWKSQYREPIAQIPLQDYLRKKKCSQNLCSLFKVKCQHCKKRLDTFNQKFEKYLRDRKMWGKDFLYTNKKFNFNRKSCQQYNQMIDALKRKIIQKMSNQFSQLYDLSHYHTVKNSDRQEESHQLKNNYNLDTQISKKKDLINRQLIIMINQEEKSKKHLFTEQKNIKQTLNYLQNFLLNLFSMFEKEIFKYLSEQPSPSGLQNHEIQKRKHKKGKNVNFLQNKQNDQYQEANELQDVYSISIKKAQQNENLMKQEDQNYQYLHNQKQNIFHHHHIQSDHHHHGHYQQNMLSADYLNKNFECPDNFQQQKEQQEAEQIGASSNFIISSKRTFKLIKSPRSQKSTRNLKSEKYMETLKNFALDKNSLSKKKIQNSNIYLFSSSNIDSQNISKLSLENSQSGDRGIDEINAKNRHTKNWKLDKNWELQDQQLQDQGQKIQDSHHTSQENNRNQLIEQIEIEEKQVVLKRKIKRRYGFIEKKNQSEDEKEWRNLKAFIKKNKKFIENMNTKLKQKNQNLPIRNTDSLLTKNRKLMHLKKENSGNISKDQDLKKYISLQKKGFNYMKERKHTSLGEIPEEQEKTQNKSYSRIFKENQQNKQESLQDNFLSPQMLKYLRNQPFKFYDLKAQDTQIETIAEVEHGYCMQQFQNVIFNYEENQRKNISRIQDTFSNQPQVFLKEKSSVLIQISLQNQQK